MKRLLYAAVVALVALAVLPERAPAKTTPWRWHHGVPVYSARDGAASRSACLRRGRLRPTLGQRYQSPSSRQFVGDWHHGVPVSPR
jgi:hypothetical protein